MEADGGRSWQEDGVGVLNNVAQMLSGCGDVESNGTEGWGRDVGGHQNTVWLLPQRIRPAVAVQRFKAGGTHGH